MRRSPSIERLKQAFPMLSDIDYWGIRHQIHTSSPLLAMENIDTILNHHGCEYVLNKNGHEVCYYSNSGDTYFSTIMYVHETDSYRLTTLGDFVESWEKRHGKLP